MEKASQSNITANPSANSNQFTLILKNIEEKNYLDNIVTIEDGQLKYHKSDRPITSYTLNLIDIAITEKSLDNKKNYKIIISSVSKSFSDKIFKHKDEKYLKNFKNFVENAITEEKNKKNKKQEIIVKISKEDKTYIKNSTTVKENEDSTRITSSRMFSQLSKVVNISDGKNNFYNFVCNLKEFEMEKKKYENIFNSDYKFLKNSNGVLIATDDIERVSKKLNDNLVETKRKEKYSENQNKFETMAKDLKSKNLKFHSIFQNFSIFLIILLICINVYCKKYGNILFSSFVFFFLMRSNNFKQILNFQVESNVTNNFKESKNFHIMSETNINGDIVNVLKLLTNYSYILKWTKYLEIIEKIQINENQKFKLKFKKYIDPNFFSVFELADCEFKIFHNVSENKIYAVQMYKTATEEEKVLNIFEFKSNDKFNKTKVTLYSIIKEDYPGFIIESITKQLNKFKKFLNHELPNTLSFTKNKISREHNYEELLMKKLYRSKVNKEEDIGVKKSEKETISTSSKITNDKQNHPLNNQTLNIRIPHLSQKNLQSTIADSQSQPKINGFIPKPFVSQTNIIKINDESLHKLKEETDILISKSILNTDTTRLSDDYFIEILTMNNYISYCDNKTNSENTNNNILFIKQYHTKKDNRKIYKAKIKMEFHIDIVVDYVKRVENRLKFNKYLKDILILHIDDKFHVEYQVVDYKLFSKLREFVLVNDYRVINLSERKIQIISSHSIGKDWNNFNKLVDNCERGFIKSCGYYFEELGAPNTCKLGFWIDSELSNDINLEDHVLKDYLNHLLEIRENMIFDYNK